MAHRRCPPGGSGVSSQRWDFVDHYARLGLQLQCSPAEVRGQYRRLARECHPDRNPENAEAEQRFKEVCASYEVLSSPRQRRAYDARYSLHAVLAGVHVDRPRYAARSADPPLRKHPQQQRHSDSAPRPRPGGTESACATPRGRPPPHDSSFYSSAPGTPANPGSAEPRVGVSRFSTTPQRQTPPRRRCSETFSTGPPPCSSGAYTSPFCSQQSIGADDAFATLHAARQARLAEMARRRQRRGTAPQSEPAPLDESQARREEAMRERLRAVRERDRQAAATRVAERRKRETAQRDLRKHSTARRQAAQRVATRMQTEGIKRSHTQDPRRRSDGLLKMPPAFVIGRTRSTVVPSRMGGSDYSCGDVGMRRCSDTPGTPFRVSCPSPGTRRSSFR
eukprot:TRINITY_DN15425_c0_g1_i1.p1 TRINITY_DN15425_c0_g1~~TRINITY_DN15425_c0_g1_i1.p1  ORF type:complete len:393 (+),score=52.44 TRINITY_DN15425_c0_g1_i1:100-1278(+)